MSGRKPRARRQGWRRLRRGRGFVYVDERGRPLRSPAALQRIRALAIPPAYRDVWICSDPRAHLQAVGRDARGRLQYRYLPEWREHRDTQKYARIAELGHRLPAIRRRIRSDLLRPRLPRTKVLAAIVALLDATGQRVGHPEYARSNGSYGLSTLRDEHLRESSARLRLVFRGKGGARQDVTVDDPLLARILRRCRDVPGRALFQYVDDAGTAHVVRAPEVNAYLRAVAGDGFSAKDLRTWIASVAALEALRGRPHTPRRLARAALKEAICAVAARLGNTPAICRKSYIDPRVIDAFLDGRLVDPPGADVRGLRKGERQYLALCEQPRRRRAD